MASLAQEKWVRDELQFAGDISRGSAKRKAIKRVQEWVTFHGFGTAIDEDFGGATAKAVKAFQAARALPVTGTVDRSTFTELTRPMREALAIVNPVPSDLSESVVAYARQHLAPHPVEVGDANCGPWVRLYMRGSEGAEFLWCAGFVCTVLRQAAEALSLPEAVKFTMSCDTLGAAAKEEGRFLPGKGITADPAQVAKIKPGSLFLIRNKSKANDWMHTGIVAAADQDSFTAIEGNTNSGGSRNGFEVCRRERGYAMADFYLLP